MTARTTVHGLQVATELHRFIEEKVLPGTGVDSADFWQRLRRHRAASWRRRTSRCWPSATACRRELDSWHKANPGPIRDMAAYRAFLEQIGYLVPPPAGAKATTANVDAELALQAGPQLVVPILNARYALNAANARWGSLYDALYGTDVIPETDGAEKGKGYNPVRGAKVIAFARNVLDQAAPLAEGSHVDATGYRSRAASSSCSLKNGTTSRPAAMPSQFVGYQGDADGAVVGAAAATTACTSTSASTAARRSARPTPPASATWCSKRRCPPSWTWKTRWPWSTPQDKVLAYGNWLGILQGTLTEQVAKGGKTFTRGLNADRKYTAPDGRRGHAARPLADVRAQRRPPDDQPGHPVRRRQGNSRRHPGRGDHHDHRAARPASARARRHPQLAHRLGLHRQAQDARPGRSGLRQRTVRPRRSSCWACPPTRSSWASWTRSAAPASTCKACIAEAAVARGLHQHRLPGPHRRRDAHRHARRPDDAQGRHEDQRLDPGLREAATCWSACRAACAAARRSARACGPCPT